jgi:hypothetical protein
MRQEQEKFRDLLKKMALDLAQQTDNIKTIGIKLDHTYKWLQEMPEDLIKEMGEQDLSKMVSEAFRKVVQQKNLKVQVEKYKKSQLTFYFLLSIIDDAFQGTGLHCPICMVKEPDQVHIPCGHVLCSNCKMNASQYRCHICRGHITHTIQLHL